jgi:hypothetical protein
VSSRFVKGFSLRLSDSAEAAAAPVMSPWTRRPAATQQEREAAQMINLALKPLHDLEAALDAAETLLNDHRGLLTDEVEAQL